jgi:hypothetical protein
MIKTSTFPVTRRNMVSLCLTLKGGGTKRHGKTEKAMRRLSKSKLGKELI